MKLSTGREVNPYLGVVGIDEEVRIYGGFDQIIEGAHATLPDSREPDEWESWTREEKIEFASIMCDRWARYAKAVTR